MRTLGMEQQHTSYHAGGYLRPPHRSFYPVKIIVVEGFYTGHLHAGVHPTNHLPPYTLPLWRLTLKGRRVYWL